MTILTDAALEFAKAHIKHYYDSDFFPKPFEFEAIWHSWADVKKFLLSMNIGKLPVMPAKAETWPKHRGGFRVVHQLEPLESIVYTALVYTVAGFVEKARIKIADGIACAYRIHLDDSGYFAHGNGYENFRERSIQLAAKYSYCLLIDVSDFYNQAYLHRVQNAIEHSSSKPKGIADDIEDFLTKLNSSVSQGLPVGPAASIVLAEALMIDVDQHLISLGSPHCRYVDDFRIFADSEEELLRIQKELTLYLYQNHRLSIAHDKTRLLTSRDFMQSDINNPYEIEKLEIFEKIESRGGYGSPEDLVDDDEDERQEQLDEFEETLIDALEAMVKRRALDLGYARALVRQARWLSSEKVAFILLKNVLFFAPLANNLCVFLNHITTANSPISLIAEISKASKIIQKEGGLLRHWFEWYLAENAKLLPTQLCKPFLQSSSKMISRAKAAVIYQDLAWVRKMKNDYFRLGPEDRRAVLYATQILPEDERVHWLKSVVNATADPLEKWVAEYIRKTGFVEELDF